MDEILKPIGFVRCKEEKVPRHWTVSELTGTLAIDEKYTVGLRDIEEGQKIVVLFHFHKSVEFTEECLIQTPPAHGGEKRGVFSTCSPRRPNPIGFSVVSVLSVTGSQILVKGLDMIDGTPILDIKPYVEA